MKQSSIRTLVRTGLGIITSIIPTIAVHAQVGPPQATPTPVITVVSGTNLMTVLGNAITRILGFAGALALLFLIYGGIIYITGGEKGASSGKTIITNAIIGVAVIVLSYVIITAVTSLLGGGTPQ